MQANEATRCTNHSLTRCLLPMLFFIDCFAVPVQFLGIDDLVPHALPLQGTPTHADELLPMHIEPAAEKLVSHI
jgi:hypothetical protein